MRFLTHCSLTNHITQILSIIFRYEIYFANKHLYFITTKILNKIMKYLTKFFLIKS